MDMEFDDNDYVDYINYMTSRNLPLKNEFTSFHIFDEEPQKQEQKQNAKQTK